MIANYETSVDIFFMNILCPAIRNIRNYIIYYRTECKFKYIYIPKCKEIYFKYYVNTKKSTM